MVFARFCGAAAVILSLGLAACETPQETLALGVVKATLVGGQSPTHGHLEESTICRRMMA